MIRYVVGIDEAGRGPLAGPVAVAAFAVPQELQYLLLKFFPRGRVRDSKKLAPAAREAVFKSLRRAKVSGQVSYAVTFSSAAAIDRRGIAAAVRSAVARALASLTVEPAKCEVFLDGALRAPSRFTLQKTIIGGDEKEAVIALASILAKVSRDRLMAAMAKKYPAYGFDKHKGYGTKGHYAALKKNGLSAIHRRSFLKNLAV